MLNLPGAPISLPRILLLMLLFIHPASAQTISDTVKRVNSHGDEGYWQQGQPDIMILWPQDRQNVVKRFTGGTEHPYPYRLWVASGRAGGFPVVLKNQSAFTNFLEHIKASPDKDWCQLAETWSNWSGSAPTACGTHSYTRQRTCSIAADALKPCPDLCKPAIQTRTQSVDNGPCQPVPVPAPTSTPTQTPAPVITCSVSAWTPGTNAVCAGQRFIQTRTLADCSTDRRTATGSKSCPKTCRVSAWSPGRDTMCSRNTLTQTRTLSDCSTDQRTVNGTGHCPSSCTLTSWAPSTNSVCSGKTFTQTRTLGNCSTGSRNATGTKYCPPICNATAWNPATNTVCSKDQFTQNRTLSDCSTDSRTASGTKHCPPSCKTTAWSPATNTVCSGRPFTQNRTLSNCSKDSRSVKGTKCCGRVTKWSPDPSTECGSFTQTRTNACGKTESRSAKGTASWCGCSWGPYTPSAGTVCKGKTFTQTSYYSCSGKTNKPRTRTATGTKSCQKAECSDGQRYCSAYTRYLCRNGKWKVIAQGPYACFTP